MHMTEDPVWTRVVLANGDRTPPRPDRARQTVNRILAGSLGALLVLLGTGYLIAARIAEHQALTDARHMTELVGETVIDPQLTPAVLQGRPAALDRLNRVVGDKDGLLRRTLIRRVKIWSTDGKVLYSNDAAEIGRSFALDDEQRNALVTGRSAAAVSDLSRAENISDRALGSRMVEVYTPLRAADGQQVLFETYISYDEVKNRRASLFTTLSILGASLLAVFALFQVGLIAVNMRWLRRRQGELQDAAEKVSTRERRNVARDLHDGVVQDLIGTSLLVEGARTSMRAGDTTRVDMLLGQMAESVRSSVQALRSTLIVVYPPTLAEDGLAQALDDLAQPLRTRGVEVTVEDRIGRRLPGRALEATYRVAQEALRNVGRHAHASTVSIQTYVVGGRLCLVVRDDGVGLAPDFQASLGKSQGHLGLRTLADAAHEVHGYLEVNTAPGRGTEIRWETPL
jgi:two-component system, NarL family, sensor kinase